MNAPLIGRERECAAVRSLLQCEDAALVTITGPGGMGKTRLALTVAQETGATFEQGTVVVLMAAMRESQLAATAIAQALGLQSQGGQQPWQQVLEYLQERRLLLVLDNFEQVIDASPWLGELLGKAPRLKVLVTSPRVY